MITFFYFLHLAANNLRRGGQRVLVALMCITFGIMALVGMTMLANTMKSSVEVTPAQLLGGDISMGRKTEDMLRPEDLEQLKSLQKNGEISRYTLIAFSSSIMFHASGSGEMHFVGNGMGIQPESYPLAGSLSIGEPGSTGLPTLFQQVGDAVITRDVAEEYHLKVGDRIILSDLRLGFPVEGTIRGIANDTPNHGGDKIYYSTQTAQRLLNGQAAVNTVIVNTDQAGTVSEKLDSSGWVVNWPAGRGDTHTANLWIIGLRGAGILGLLVGGIGIANTMQVLLRRRQHEIAIWKTLGYRDGDLRLVFSLEAGLLGLAGSLLGAGLGVLISTGLLVIFRRTSSMLYEWTFSPTPPLMGILVGTLTTVIFAYWAIVVSSQSRPMALLRNQPVDFRRIPRRQAAGLGLILAVPFAVMTGLVMESALAGMGVLLGIVSGLVLLGGFFSGLLWVCTRILPTHRFPLVDMAFKSLRRRGMALVFAMIALFIGVLSMSMGLLVAQKGRGDIAAQPADFQSYNVNILGTADQEAAIRRAIDTQDPVKVGLGYRTALVSLKEAGGGPVSASDPVLVGRTDPQDYVINGAAWGSQPEGVYAYRWANLKAGSQVEAAFRDGSTRIFRVVGTYEVNLHSINLYPPTGLLMTAEAFRKVARPDSLIYFVEVQGGQIDRAANSLTASLPQATVLNLVDYAGRFMQSYQNVYVVPMVMAGLALLAGLLLVANSVSLAMLDRRYEIGILKTSGYSRRQILSIFGVEYGMAGLLATGAGVFLIQGLLALLALGNHLAINYLLLSIPALALVGFCGIGLTVLVVFGVTWEPTKISPLVILNGRN